MVDVLIVDDLKTVRQMMKDIFSLDPSVRVVGMTDNEQEALRLIRELDPALVLLASHVQKASGYDLARKIMAFAPRPIIVAAGPSENLAESVATAYASGVLEVVSKAELYHWRTRPEAARRFVRKVKTLAKIQGGGRLRPPRPPPPAPQLPMPPSLGTARGGAVAIVSSTGGPHALECILRVLPATPPGPILVVQHMSKGFIQGLAEYLDGRCALEVRLARDGELPAPGAVLLAPDDFHLTVTGNGRIRLLDEAPVRGHRPSGDYLFGSLADHAGRSTLGILLTGMGQDGARGLKRLREAGGRTAAQDEQSSVVFGMPKSAIDLDAVDRVLPLDEIPAEIVRFWQKEPMLTARGG